MSASPPPPDPHRRPLGERSGSHNNKLQIRIVPYSPPRLSSDGSTASRVVSCTDVHPTSPRLSHTSRELSVESDTQPNWQTSTNPDVSALRRSPVHSSPAAEAHDANIHAPAPPTSPMRRAQKIISVNSDKTFSLLPQSRSASSRSESVSVRSPLSSFNTPRSSYGRYSSDAFVEDRPSSPLTPLAEDSLADSSPPPAPIPPSGSPSPWNQRLIGGLRLVRKTPDAKQKQPSHPSTSSSTIPLPSLPALVPQESASFPPLSVKSSFQSSKSDSTVSERTNYKVYGRSSPAVPTPSAAFASSDLEIDQIPPSSSHSNYQIHGEPSSSDQSLNEQPRPQTGDSDANYVIHRQRSTSLSVASSKSQLRSEYSRESLVVPPLRPTRQRSLEFAGLTKSRSRDSLRTGSLTSISTIISQEATRVLFAGPATIHIPPRLYRHTSREASSSTDYHTPQMITAHPHQWSSQLSTVMSESEEGSEPPTRSVSSLSGPNRRSSGFGSIHSRQMLSISSASVVGLEETPRHSSHSRSGSLDRPQPVHSRHAGRESDLPNTRLVRDLDEDGDGLADLEALHHRPSRTRLNSVLSNKSSDRNLRSSSSSRANSLTGMAIPMWARLYYGSGERKLLVMQSSDSLFSQYNDSRPTSAFHSRSPSAEQFAGNIYSPRRRPRDYQPQQAPTHDLNRDSLDISPNPIANIARGLKKQTSSIWSPHLQLDRRATAYSIWEPPSRVWSAESGHLGHRNMQFLLFIAGFIFPFAWMIAAVLPLPLNPQLEMAERLQSTSDINLPYEASGPEHRATEARYRGAEWWRNVNRGMSIIGLLVIGAVVALSVVGVRQQW